MQIADKRRWCDAKVCNITCDMKAKRITFATRWTAFAVMIAFVMSTFAHISPRAPEPAGLLAFVAAGGSLGDLCGGDITDDATGTKCEACRLVGAALIPAACDMAPEILSDGTRAHMVVARDIHHARPHDPARQPRAPPQA
ncbi:hypothetical protein OO012_08460 [Rhodobacteraceae bacterium KMM 6894]|nr:hypothetical protein [Rhodobacteraceae bacterium KMM 6894]